LRWVGDGLEGSWNQESIGTSVGGGRIWFDDLKVTLCNFKGFKEMSGGVSVGLLDIHASGELT